MRMRGDIEDVIAAYSKDTFSQNHISLTNLPRPSNASQELTFDNIRIHNSGADVFEGDRIKLQIEYTIHSFLEEYILGLTVSNGFQSLIECRSTATLPALSGSPKTQNLVEVSIALPLKADTYILNLGARSSKGLLDYVSNAFHIVVLPRDSKKCEPWLQPSYGVLISDSNWVILS